VKKVMHSESMLRYGNDRIVLSTTMFSIYMLTRENKYDEDWNSGALNYLRFL
jgi:hypothetical protein